MKNKHTDENDHLDEAEFAALTIELALELDFLLDGLLSLPEETLSALSEAILLAAPDDARDVMKEALIHTGDIVDSGKAAWNDRTGSYETLWVHKDDVVRH